MQNAAGADRACGKGIQRSANIDANAADSTKVILALSTVLTLACASSTCRGSHEGKCDVGSGSEAQICALKVAGWAGGTEAGMVDRCM